MTTTRARRFFFGGSFNPIHHGHLICARAVAERQGYRRVVLIPSGQPPHKAESAVIAPAADRLKMCRLATCDCALFSVDDLELKRAGPSFTIETIRQLAANDTKRVDWLIGADMLLYLPHWHRADELLRETNFIVMARPGWTLDWRQLPPSFRSLEDRVVEAPMIDISATDIRRRVAMGMSIDYLTPPSVCEHIVSQGLYRKLPPT